MKPPMSGNHNQVFACIEQPRLISSRFCSISAEYMGRAKDFLKTLTSVVIILYRLRAREKQRLWGKRSIIFRHYVCIRTQRSSSSSCSACSTHSSSLSSILPSALFFINTTRLLLLIYRRHYHRRRCRLLFFASTHDDPLPLGFHCLPLSLCFFSQT